MALSPQERMLAKQLAVEQRRREGEALRMYRPMPTQVPFHVSEAAQRVVRGGNRAGKTVCSAAEMSVALVGGNLYGPNGEVLPRNYPDPPLKAWVIGFNIRHIGGTIHRMLFEPGAFRIIKDKKTKQWRAWRPWEDEDKDRIDETRPSPPFIPGRFIDPRGWAWEDKAERAFAVCRLKNGSELWAWPSTGQVGQGVAVDLLWIDEDIVYSQYVSEWEARLSDGCGGKGGRMFWSAWPHLQNDALVKMSERAEDQKHRAKPDVEEWVLTFSGNPYILDDEKRKRIEGWSDEEVRTRDQGEFLTDTIAMYPQFNKWVHDIPQDPSEYPIDKAMIGNQVPADWTHYVSIDPGTTFEAALLASVPPPHIGDYVVVWGEVYIRGSSAEKLARAILSLSSGKEYYAFIMDEHAGRQTPGGFGKTRYQQYRETFERFGLRSYVTGSSFIPGSGDISGRAMVVREWLTHRPNLGPKLRIVVAACPNTVREFGLYKKRIVQNEIKDAPVDRNNHAMDALGYLAHSDPRYHAVKPGVVKGPAYRMWERWQRAGESRDFGDTIHCGPGERSSGNSRVLTAL